MDEWRRPIGPAAYARGVSACLENARGLIEDALVLLESGRTARAVALGILALEEGDKIKRVFRIALMTDPTAIKREWAAFRDHRPKLSSSLSLLTHGGFSIVTDRVARKKPLPPAGSGLRTCRG
jgi:AbiV family abortive infection protein